MKIKKILKFLLLYIIMVFGYIWLANIINDKHLYNGILDIFTRFDYRAINFVFMTYQICLGYCIYKSIKFIKNKFKRKKEY